MSRRWRGLLAPGLATVVVAALLVGLGLWQLRRLAWKEGLIAAVEARVHAEPVDVPPPSDWPALKPADYEYRHVRVSGVYDFTRQALVFRALSSPRGRFGGPGYLVMTPLKLASGETVLINRGFVPEEMKGAAQTTGVAEATVSGLMRATEDRTWFTPADDPAKGVWFTRDVGRIADALNLGPHAPFSIDADAGADPNALPEGGETVLAFPNNHFSYAMTWFGTALALVGVFIAYAFAQIRAR